MSDRILFKEEDERGMAKDLLEARYRYMTRLKAAFHSKGTFNRCDSEFASRAISQLSREIDFIQEFLLKEDIK